MLTALLSSPLVLAALGVGLILFLLRQWSGGEDAPPGPWGIPLFGYLPFLGRKMNVGLTTLSRKYGDVFTVGLGTRQTVVICGSDAVREAFAPGKEDFSGRPDFFTYRLADTAFGFADWSPRYRALRKIGVKSLGMFANTRNEGLEETAVASAEDFISVCKERAGEAFNPKDDLYRIVCGIMGFICYGKRFQREDEELQRILGSADEVGKTVVAGVLVDFIPSLGFLMKGQTERYKRVMNKIRGYSHHLVTKVLEDRDPSQPPQTVAAAMAKAGEDMSDEDKAALSITDTYIKGMVSNLFGAGFGTISITIRWALMLMAKNMEAQNRLFFELYTVLGEGGEDREGFSFKNIKDLPYLNASVTEIYRYSSIASLAITHSATKDTVFRGYKIAKGTPVIPNFYSAHHDPRYFPEPAEFRPERFLKEDGSFNTALMDRVMPYGSGHRRCGGEALARLEVYLFLATIFHRCQVVESPDSPLDPVNGYNFTFGLDPKPFKIIMKSRFREW